MHINRMAYILSKTPILYRAAYYKNIIFGSVHMCKVTCVKNYGHFSPNKSDAMMEKRFRLRDNLTEDYKLIYRENNAVHRMIIFSYYSGWFILLFVIFSIGYLIIKDPPLLTKEEDSAIFHFNTKSQRMITSISGAFLPIMLILICRTMPFRIYHSPSQQLYKAVFINNILHKKRNIETYGEHCAVPMFSRIKFLADTLFKINGRAILLDRECFAVQAIREKMIYRVK